MKTTDIAALPSTQKLLKATALAVVAAAAILVVTVLPAEYGVDPTGIGRALGLDALRGAQKDPAAEFAATPSAAVAPSAVGNAPVAEENFPASPGQTFDRKAIISRDRAVRTESMSLTIAPGKGAEIKANMASGDSFIFHWAASGPVAIDMHGEPTHPVAKEYSTYSMARSKQEASGLFTAPFAGRHGWYWVNLGTKPVTVHVEVTGFQQPLFRPAPK